MAPVFKGDSINHEKRTPRTRGWHGSTVVRRLPSPSRLPHPLSYLSLSSPSPSLFSLPLTLALSLSLSLSVPCPFARHRNRLTCGQIDRRSGIYDEGPARADGAR